MSQVGGCHDVTSESIVISEGIVTSAVEVVISEGMSRISRFFRNFDAFLKNKS